MGKRLHRGSRVDPEKLDRQTVEVNEILAVNAENMTAIAKYLESRSKQNGFGRDFEFTLRTRKTT